MGLEMNEEYWKEKWKIRNKVETLRKHTLGFGKYFGRTFESVADEDKGHCD